jgi:ankyrin repeat protein
LKPDVLGRSALDVAVEQRNLKLVEVLVADGRFDPNRPGPRGMTPLYRACEIGDAGIVKALLKHPRIQVDLPTGPAGVTPLYCACDQGHLQAVESLLADGRVNPNIRRSGGICPLHVAIDRGHEKVALALLRAKADANLETDSGISPLHFATLRGSIEVMDELIKRGARRKCGAGDALDFAPPLPYGGYMRALLRTARDN